MLVATDMSGLSMGALAKDRGFFLVFFLNRWLTSTDITPSFLCLMLTTRSKF